MSDYITVAGIIQFDPRERSAAGKDVRDVAVRAIGNNKMVNITVWPENNDVPLNKGDFIVADGKFTSSPGQNKAGEAVTYNNLSATVIYNLTGSVSAQPKKKAADKEAAVAGESGDNFPF
jgi:hypothetical protein